MFSQTGFIYQQHYEICKLRDEALGDFNPTQTYDNANLMQSVGWASTESFQLA